MCDKFRRMAEHRQQIEAFKEFEEIRMTRRQSLTDFFNRLQRLLLQMYPNHKYRELREHMFIAALREKTLPSLAYYFKINKPMSTARAYQMALVWERMQKA